MSFERLRYDPCSYEQRLKESVGPGLYMINEPADDCKKSCSYIPSDPYIRWQRWGPGFCAPGAAIDDSSDLLGLTRRASECPDKHYLPGDAVKKPACGGGPATVDPRSCMAPTEDTRLSNPPSTLRCTGWNRWQWLCDNPQDHALIPFQIMTNYRIVVKDNHRACVQTPINQDFVMPPTQNQNNTVDFFSNWKPPAFVQAPGPGPGAGQTWRSPEFIKAL